MTKTTAATTIIRTTMIPPSAPPMTGARLLLAAAVVPVVPGVILVESVDVGEVPTDRYIHSHIESVLYIACTNRENK